MKKKKNPIPTYDDKCIICMTPYAHTHEIFFGNPDARLSQEWGMTVKLCQYHHQDHKVGVHHNRENDLMLKRYGQQEFEKLYGHDKFMEIFGRNYL